VRTSDQFEDDDLMLGTSTTLAAPTMVSVTCNGFELGTTGHLQALQVQQLAQTRQSPFLRSKGDGCTA
jgi:hypothetical protein